MKEIAKFMVMWRYNPMAPWPADPTEIAKMWEMMWAGIDNNLKTGETLELGYFANATSGYGISSGETKDQFRHAYSFYPFFDIEVHEIVPYETGKEIMKGVMKAQAEAMKR
ncbi:MAG: hypothetical protein WBZ42_08455 [Halobacteriota archaeon]